MGASPKYADQIENEQAQGRRLDLADLRSSRSQPTAPDGHGTEYGIPIPTISSPEEARAVVDALVAEGADFIGEIVYDDGSEFGVRLHAHHQAKGLEERAMPLREQQEV